MQVGLPVLIEPGGTMPATAFFSASRRCPSCGKPVVRTAPGALSGAQCAQEPANRLHHAVFQRIGSQSVPDRNFPQRGQHLHERGKVGDRKIMPGIDPEPRLIGKPTRRFQACQFNPGLRRIIVWLDEMHVTSLTEMSSYVEFNSFVPPRPLS